MDSPYAEKPCLQQSHYGHTLITKKRVHKSADKTQ